ncbi:hypothetical protein ZWY2020_012420 [Hordeum vulgare]|nr:hypothetical protein ZWY2020_012420 [Hordeum vulgare]
MAKRMISQRTHTTMFTRTSSCSKLFNCDDLQQHQRLGSTPEPGHSLITSFPRPAPQFEGKEFVCSPPSDLGLIGHVKLEYDVPPSVDHKLAM